MGTKERLYIRGKYVIAERCNKRLCITLTEELFNVVTKNAKDQKKYVAEYIRELLTFALKEMK